MKRFVTTTEQCDRFAQKGVKPGKERIHLHCKDYCPISDVVITPFCRKYAEPIKIKKLFRVGPVRLLECRKRTGFLPIKEKKGK